MTGIGGPMRPDYRLGALKFGRKKVEFLGRNVEIITSSLISSYVYWLTKR
jgi:hypothetical protein